MDVLRLLLVSLAGWGNQQQEHMIDYLQEEIRSSEVLNLSSLWQVKVVPHELLETIHETH